jgi:hypothetical protein
MAYTDRFLPAPAREDGEDVFCGDKYKRGDTLQKPVLQNPPTDSEERVPKCEVTSNGISFSSIGYWYDDKDLLVLKPSYTFSFVESENKKI